MPCVALGVTGDKVRMKSSSSSGCGWSVELRNRCGPLGPSMGFDGKLMYASWLSLGVGASSYEDIVVKLGWPDFKSLA